MLTAYELIGYGILALVLRLIWHRLSDSGQDRTVSWLVIAASVVILLVILTGVDWDALRANWRDLAANALIAAAVLSLVIGYGRILSMARRRARHGEEEGEE
ncbi:MAG: hypothetical protein AAGI13_13985 [Pseudomonadota bacterium]